MADILSTAIGFLIALVISTIIIYLVAKLTGEKEGIGTAVLAALIGTVIYTITYWLLGNGLLAAVLGGIVWLLALKGLYGIGWLKALLVAILIWIITAIVGIFLPTLTGPL
ncbi:MAG: hypothetical protein SA339_09385 [Methanomassiliicoccus sp.]|nr:hypothetical protein [Methanomassiliicoccus sp.]